MSYELMMFCIVAIAMCITMVLVPYLKKKGLWVAALFGCNIIEQVCAFLDLQGYGAKKYEFVKKVLLMLSPKLTDVQIDELIETIVAKINDVKKA